MDSVGSPLHTAVVLESKSWRLAAAADHLLTGVWIATGNDWMFLYLNLPLLYAI